MSTPSLAAAHTLVTALRRLGVRDVVLAPGSRSAPLAYALAHAAARPDGPPLRLHVRVDERDAGFLALGLATAGRLRAEGDGTGTAAPVAVVTTSGTAVANLHPAVLEAHHAGVPLLLLTADRPHELRGTGANQTADQVGIFGTATRLAVDVPAPDGRPGEDRDLRALVSRAVVAASGARTGHPGPVQLNLGYRDPLAPTAEDVTLLTAPWVDEAGADLLGLADAVPQVRADDPRVLALGLDREPATVVVAGDGAGPAARALAEARGWPLLAEASSGASAGPAHVAAHRLVLAGSPLADEVRQVVVLGRPTVSRPVQTLLARPDVRAVVVEPSAEQWTDASRTAAVVLSAVPASWTAEPVTGSAWLEQWRRASDAAATVVDAAAAAGLTSLAVAAAVARASGTEDVLVVGSSSPVRDLELVTRWADQPTVVANRGLAGIDGTVSTALGVAAGVQADRRATVRALLGDLTFLHDVGGLLRGPHEPAAQLQVVVVNDGGGAIFATLEHGSTADAAVFERVFATPHEADLGALCAGYGVRHEAVTDVERLHAVLAAPGDGVSVVEVRVSRAGRGDEGRLLAEQVRGAVRR